MKNVVAHHICSHWISMWVLSILCVGIYYGYVISNYPLGLFSRFDVAGAGASLKRYSDPSFFKMGQTSNMIEPDYLREKKPRRIKASNTFSITANISLVVSLCATYFTERASFMNLNKFSI
jgi:hypothetical protein